MPKRDRAAYQRQWRAANHEKTLAWDRVYKAGHRTVLRQRAKGYRDSSDGQVVIQATRARRRDGNRAYQRELYRQLRTAGIMAYGGVCVCCGESSLAFLTIDHTQNDGGKHRREPGVDSGAQIYRWLKKNDYPKDRFQVLCYNCNCSKQHDPQGHRLAHPRAELTDGGAVAEQACRVGSSQPADTCSQ